MKKVQIKVFAGIKFLSHWRELWTYLPENEHYILNKNICGCGATEACSSAQSNERHCCKRPGKVIHGRVDSGL